LRAAVAVGWLQVVGVYNLQPANSYKCTQLTRKTASVVPPEDGRLTPETCSGLRHNKVIVKVKYVLSWLRYCDLCPMFHYNGISDSRSRKFEPTCEVTVITGTKLHDLHTA
jgi:hypothetical protein